MEVENNRETEGENEKLLGLGDYYQGFVCKTRVRWTNLIGLWWNKILRCLIPHGQEEKEK